MMTSSLIEAKRPIRLLLRMLAGWAAAVPLSLVVAAPASAQGLTVPGPWGAIVDHDKPLEFGSDAERATYLRRLAMRAISAHFRSVEAVVTYGAKPAPGQTANDARALVDEAAALAAMQQAGVAALATRGYATLSGGERQRVRFAQLLAQAPRYLLLDEPLQHLDLRYQIQLLDLLALLVRNADRPRAVVMVLHDVLWPARYCTHALLLDGTGAARAGVASEILTQPNLEALFGCALQSAGDKSGAGFVPAL